MAILTSTKSSRSMSAVLIAGGGAVLSVVAELLLGSFPVDIFRFPLNILVVALWFVMIQILYRRRTGNAFARFMLSRRATWLSLGLMATIGIVLGLEREPSTTAWPVVASLLFVLSHLCFVILRGWCNAKGIRWRFCLTHVGLLLALGAGFWGAPDRQQLRMAVHRYPSNEAYTMDGELRPTPYTVELCSFRMEHADNGAPTHYEAEIKVDDKKVMLFVNHPYNRTLSEKIYLVSFGKTLMGETYAVIEIVKEPWQWLSAAGIIMLIAGAVLLFVQGPRKTVSGER
ncbi:MAG: cytochrome c biogenesis protein ResB [Bacteroidaceae bacterium]|nr:cytochrome c biogenesis protein ResB [Bacteroidaceae bacterium]